MTANVETMAYRFADRTDVPWHGLGERVQRNEEVTTYEFQRRAGLLWEVVKEPLYIRKTKENEHYIADHVKTEAMALIRKDTAAVLNIVTSLYKEVQNTQIFEFFRKYCESGGLEMETAGSLDGGKTIWVLARMKYGFTLAGGDRVQSYVLLSNSHAGRKGRGKITAIRVVCANTLAAALFGGGAEIAFSHKSVFDPEAIRQALGLPEQQVAAFAQQCEFLTSRPLNGASFKNFINTLFPVEVDKEGEKKVPRWQEKVQTAYTQQPMAGLPDTWWQAYNAVTYAVDHDSSRSDKAARLNSNWFGNGEKIKQRAFTVAMEMAQ